MSSKMTELLKTSYIDRVYFPMPFSILHPGEMEVDEEGLTMPHPPRSAPQEAAETLIGGAPISGAKRTIHAKVKAEVESKVSFKEHSFSIVEHCQSDFRWPHLYEGC